MKEKVHWRPISNTAIRYCPWCDVETIVSQLLSSTEFRYANGDCCKHLRTPKYEDITFSAPMRINDQGDFNHLRISNDARRYILSREPFLTCYMKLKNKSPN